MRKYECIYVLRPDLTEDQEKKVTSRIQGIIEDNGGKVMIIDDWGVRRTAYPVQKNNKARYIQMTYAAAPTIVSEVERIMRMLEEVFKFCTMRVEDSVSAEELEQDLVRKTSKRDEHDRGDRRNRRDFNRGDRRSQSSEHPAEKAPVEA